MRVVLQRVKYASVKVDGEISGQIQQGLLLLIGFKADDTIKEIEKLAKKCVELRIFEDENGKLNLGVKEVGGKILSVSQFTLYANCKKGRRPGFDQAMKAQEAKKHYELFNEELKKYDIDVECGIFQADMKVELLNDGPVTIILDSDEM